MDRSQVEKLLAAVREGAVSPADAASQLAQLPYADEAARDVVVDPHRELRTGVPELVFGASKTPEQIAIALQALAKHNGGALATRVDGDKARAVKALLPDAVVHDVPRAVTLGPTPARPPCAPISIVCAGTSDLPIAEEAALVAEFLGAPVTRIADVGVAGLHRLLARLDDIRKADVIIAVAGMEAALPSVLGGLVALGGLLASCAPGITVVNIDNGVGAAVAAVKIGRLAVRP